MGVPRGLRAVLPLAALAVLAGCASWSEPDDAAPSRAPPVEAVPDAVPRAEPRSRYGNPPSYVVFGERYHTLPSAAGFVERGIASWYGSKFHGRRTSSGETYDMYAMTAAHRSLPLPSYVRVTNLENGRAVVVRVNDRGPFHDGRVIDLSYTAARKLDVVRNGTARVEVRALVAGEAPPPVLPGSASLFVQAGAFADAANAARLGEQLRMQLRHPVRVEPMDLDGTRLHRVRIGPVETVAGADQVLVDLDSIGIPGARLVVE